MQIKKNLASYKGPPTNIEKNWSYVMQKHLKFFISSDFLVVRLKRIVPLNKVHAVVVFLFWHFIVFDPIFILSRNTDPR